MVLQNLTSHDLSALAWVCATLREVAERQLYEAIMLPHKPEDILHVVEDAPNTLSPPYRTLCQSSTLARRVQRLDLMVLQRGIEVKIPTPNVYPRGLPFSNTMTIELHEPEMAGALLHVLNSLKDLTLLMVSNHPGTGSTKFQYSLISTPLNHLLPGFKFKTAHTVTLPGLQNLERLEWYGKQFH
jgi:hypothetical protein